MLRHIAYAIIEDEEAIDKLCINKIRNRKREGGEWEELVGITKQLPSS